MPEGLIIDLGNDVPADLAQHIQNEIGQVDAVDKALPMTTRGVDASSVMLWVQVGTGVLTAAGGAVALIGKVIEIIRGKGIKGARIKLPSGVEISADEASLKDLSKMVAAATPEK